MLALHLEPQVVIERFDQSHARVAAELAPTHSEAAKLVRKRVLGFRIHETH